MVRGHMGLKVLLAIVVAASVFLAGVLATGNTASARIFGEEWISQSIAITSEPENGDTYRIGEVIDVTLSYNIDMEMPENSAIGIAVGNNLRLASIDKERWSVSLFIGGGDEFEGFDFVFSYTVQPDDFDSDGVSISETVFGFYNSTSDAYVPDPIPVPFDIDDAVSGYPGLSVQSGHKVDGRPRIDHVEIVSSPASDNTYRTGESIDVDITFDQPVDIVDDNIAASLWFGKTNGGEGSVRRGAPYQDGSGTDTLRFSYQVRPGDYDSNGLHVGAKTSTGFGAGRIKAAGTDADAVHFFAGVNSSQRVDGRVRVDGMEVLSHPASGGTYRAGETFEIAMVFSRPVEVEGNIHLSMRVGSDDPAIGWRAATYRRAHGSDSLIFGYTVRFGDMDTDGITVLGSWVGYGGTLEGIGGSGSIKVAGTDFEIEPPEFNGVTNLGGHKVNGNPDTENVGGL